MRFFVIRHGETAWNVEGRFQGQKDTALNEKGLAQAATLGERLAGHSFEAVLTSPLDRAKKTAELAASKCKFGEFTEIPAFTEINHGDWEGRLSTEVAEEWPELLRRWHTAPETVKMPGEGGESLEDIARRAVPAVEAAAKKIQGRRAPRLARRGHQGSALLLARRPAFELFQVPGAELQHHDNRGQRRLRAEDEPYGRRRAPGRELREPRAEGFVV